MIVVDVGCHPHGPEESVLKLVARFDPEILFGFDPHPDHVEGVEMVARTVVVRRRSAAMVKVGPVSVAVDGDRTAVRRFDHADDEVEVPGIDLPAFVAALPRPVVLKLDCEGAEFPILWAIHEQGIDRTLDLVLVEWHEGEDRKGDFYGHGWAAMGRPKLLCSVEEWE